jgi:hypothetical protein
VLVEELESEGQEEDVNKVEDNHGHWICHLIVKEEEEAKEGICCKIE